MGCWSLLSSKPYLPVALWYWSHVFYFVRGQRSNYCCILTTPTWTLYSGVGSMGGRQPQCHMGAQESSRWRCQLCCRLVTVAALAIIGSIENNGQECDAAWTGRVNQHRSGRPFLRALDQREAFYCNPRPQSKQNWINLTCILIITLECSVSTSIIQHIKAALPPMLCTHAGCGGWQHLHNRYSNALVLTGKFLNFPK